MECILLPAGGSDGGTLGGGGGGSVWYFRHSSLKFTLPYPVVVPEFHPFRGMMAVLWVANSSSELNSLLAPEEFPVRLP